MRAQNLKALLLAALAAVVFLTLVGRRNIVTSHEARVAQTARQMAAVGWPWNARPVEVAPVKKVTDAAGVTRFQAQWDEPPIRVNPWLVPVMSGEIRLQKPPLPYWCAATLYRLAGVEWSEALSRLTPALLGALATLLLFDLTRRTLGRTAGWAAALAWVSSYFVAEQYRLAMADPYLAFFTLAAMWAWVRRLTLPFYLFVGLGLLAKGPPLFIPLAAGIVAYHVCFRRPMPRGVLAHVLGPLLVLLIVLPWLAYVFRHVPNVMDVWRYESLGELPGGDNIEKARPFWFYFVNLFQITMPWMPVWVVGCVLPWVKGRSHTKRYRRRLLFPVAWYFAVVIFFSLLPVKKNTYLLPAVAAQALIVAQGLVALVAVVRRFPKSALIAWVQAVIGIAGGGAAVVLCVTKVPAAHRTLAVTIAAMSLLTAIAAIVALARQQGRSWLCRQSAAYAIAIVAVFNFWRSDADNQRSAKPVCSELSTIMAQTGEPLAPAKRPEEAALYLPLELPLKLRAPSMLTIVDDPRHTSKSDPARFADRVPWRKVIAAERVPMKTAPGEGARWRVFRLTLE